MVTVRSAATVAENKPVYNVPVYAQDGMNVDAMTHEDKDSLSILLPGFHHLVVFIFDGLGIHGEELLRAVTEVRFFMRWLVRHQLREVGVDSCRREI